MSLFKLIGIGNRSHADVAGANVATEQEPDFTVPSQARADKQKFGRATKDVSGGTTWTVSEAEAVNKVLRPTGQDAAYTVVIPDDGLFIIDTTAGADASGNDATVQCEGGSGVTVNDGHGAVVVAVGGTATKLDVSG